MGESVWESMEESVWERECVGYRVEGESVRERGRERECGSESV